MKIVKDSVWQHMLICVYVVTLQAEENLGMVMIFTLVTAVQEKLNEIVDMMKNRREEEDRRKEREREEAEKVVIIIGRMYVHLQYLIKTPNFYMLY